MNITLHEITVREISEGYINTEEGGVWAYGGRLNIRPPFQREFIYSDKQRDDVIRSILNDFPLNVMYWVVNDGGKYEMLDGQQRTISICEYLAGNFSVKNFNFTSLANDEQEKILSYKLMIYFCEGTDSEKRDWFNIVNIAGEQLTPQELRNAIYPGAWITDAKRHFSKRNSAAQIFAGDYLSGDPIRQDYLQTVLKWFAEYERIKVKGGGDIICECMSKHQNDSGAEKLWLYFQNVINWVKSLFPNYRKEMQGLNWGYYYNNFHDKDFDAHELEARLLELFDDDEITRNAGIYEYLIDGQEKHLSLRTFSPKEKRKVYERQKGKCKRCGKNFDISQMEADHITPWSQGGHTTLENCQLLCKSCNRKKGAK